MKLLTAPSSGSQDGLTTSRNRFGQYQRRRSIPVNPNTAKQAARRAQFASASAQWRGLSLANQLLWNNYANEVPVVDSLGQTQFLTGHQQFVGVNALNAILDSTPTLIELPPALPAFVGIAPTAAIAGLVSSLVFSLTSGDFAGQIEIFATPAVSSGRAFSSVKNQLRLIAPAGAGVTPTLAIPATLIPLVLTTYWNAVFGPGASLPDDATVAVWFAIREISNFQRGPLIPIRATVTV